MKDKNTETEVFIDSINGKVCRLLAGSDSKIIDMPLEFIPAGAKEGDWFSMSFTLRPDLAEKSKNETKDLLDSLGDICK
jgi:hypothetical protein